MITLSILHPTNTLVSLYMVMTSCFINKALVRLSHLYGLAARPTTCLPQKGENVALNLLPKDKAFELSGFLFKPLLLR